MQSSRQEMRVTLTRLAVAEVARSGQISGYILKAEPTGIPDGLDVRCESSLKNYFKDWGWGDQRSCCQLNSLCGENSIGWGEDPEMSFGSLEFEGA